MKTTIAILALLGYASAASLKQMPIDLLQGPSTSSEFFDSVRTLGERQATE